MEWSLGLFYNDVDEIYTQLVNQCRKDLDGKEVKIVPFMPESETREIGRTLFVANGSASEGGIKLGMLSNQILWHLCWYGYSLWIEQEGNIDLDDLLHRLHAIDNFSTELDEIFVKDMKMWDSKFLSLVYAFATNFILCHEIGHIVYKHNLFDSNGDFRTLEELRLYEYAADAYSMQAINTLAEKREQQEAAYIGVIVAQCLMFFIRKESVDYDNDPHGDPMVRIEHKLAVMKCDNKRFWDLVNKLKALADRFILEKYRDIQ